ncbi:MAG: hypothetical protein IJR00_10425 [Lachnospiraceae bacterium]|nr:hypothetical protein [Lachnospiraceae bacterium]
MINEERVILMTKMSVKADELNREGMRINQFYRGDYVGFEVVKAVISATVLFVVLMGAYALFRFDEILNEFYSGSGLDGFRKYILYYFVLAGVYVIVSYIIYSIRYNRARKQAREYYHLLKELEREH